MYRHFSWSRGGVSPPIPGQFLAMPQYATAELCEVAIASLQTEVTCDHRAKM
jgi:hypothetical protein